MGFILFSFIFSMFPIIFFGAFIYIVVKGVSNTNGNKNGVESSFQNLSKTISKEIDSFSKNFTIRNNIKTPDWTCEYCSSRNHGDATECASCGAKRKH